MRIWAAAIIVVGMGSGCKYGPYAFTCTGDPSCGPTGACEVNGFCSFPDATCTSGRRYGDLGGASSGQCVGSQSMPDGGMPDVPPGVRMCFGAAPFTVCFTTPPIGAIDVSLPTTFNTDTGTVSGTQLNCAAPTSGGTGYCVLAADTINIGASLRAVGTKPLVLVAATSISVPLAGSIDVGSHRMGAVDSIGAGADPTTGCNAGTPPTAAANGSGGGAGGSFMGAGGNGGIGGGGGSPGAHGLATPLGTVLRGGCPGQDGAGTGHGARGHGGGAVFLIAGNRITVGGTINAGGEGGGGATGNTIDGGGGGGSGGLIGFDAMTITVTGTLIANGGGGGEGSSNQNGNPGADAIMTTAALGGTLGSSSGGDGGSGSAGAAAGPGAVAQDGNPGGGGGGGGGGAGVIKGPPASLGTKLSPAATP